MFRNTWAFIDPSCDTTGAFRTAARTFYGCRAESCDNTLGGDDVCADEDSAFRAAEETYGKCVSSAD